jgi:hypothetical protein
MNKKIETGTTLRVEHTPMPIRAITIPLYELLLELPWPKKTVRVKRPDDNNTQPLKTSITDRS